MSKSRSGAPKRVAAGLLAGALTVLGLGFAPSAGATADVKTDRYAGTTRYGTAAAIAGHNGPAPIILTQSGTYTQAARDALNEFTSVADVMCALAGTLASVSNIITARRRYVGSALARVARVGSSPKFFEA